MRCGITSAAIGLLLLGGAALAADKDSDDKQTREDLAAVKAYLEKNYKGKKWQTGPARLDSEVIRTAYGKRRFYFVFSSPPLPPGANVKSIQDAYRRRLADFLRQYLSLTVALGPDGKITPLRKPADFNEGLMKVADDEGARTAAAAILSLYGSGRVGPGVVSAREVTVSKKDRGRECWVRGKHYQGRVTFDAEGKCRSVFKTYTGPLPP